MYAGTTVGIFTCFDVAFPSPGPALAALGVRAFVFSAAIPIVDRAAALAWSDLYNSTLFNSNLQAGESGVFQRGRALTDPPPPAGGLAVLVADV